MAPSACVEVLSEILAGCAMHFQSRDWLYYSTHVINHAGYMTCGLSNKELQTLLKSGHLERSCSVRRSQEIKGFH